MKNNNEVSKKKESVIKNKLKQIIPSMSAETYKVAVIIFIVFIVFLSIARIITIENSVEFPGFTSENSNYKLADTVYTSVFLAMYVAGGVAALLLAVFSHNVSYSSTKRSNPFVFVSSLVGFCMVGCAGFFVYRSTLVEQPLTKTGLWVVILMLFTGSYFAMDAVGFISEKLRPLFSFGTMAFCMVRLMYEFLNCHNFQSFSSNEYHLVALTLMLLFFSSNTKFHVYGKAGFLFKFYGLFSALSLLIYTLPEIYISLFEPYYVDSTFIFSVVDAVLAFYILAKILSVRKIKPENVGAKNE